MTERLCDDDMEMETGRYFSFMIGDGTFAIEITENTGVREVLNPMAITEVPGMPDCLPGLINVRGNIVSTVDLRPILGIGGVERRADSCFVIVETQLDGESLQLGILADSVREVTDFSSAKINSAPEIGTGMNPEYATELAQFDDGYVILLEMENIVRDIGHMVLGLSNGKQSSRSDAKRNDKQTAADR